MPEEEQHADDGPPRCVDSRRRRQQDLSLRSNTLGMAVCLGLSWQNVYSGCPAFVRYDGPPSSTITNNTGQWSRAGFGQVYKAHLSPDTEYSNCDVPRQR